VKAEVPDRLIELNRQFYHDFGEPFAATRRRLQPGVGRVLDSLKGEESILDLGCGNGELARALARRAHRGAYLGLDFSRPMLSAGISLQGFTAEFMEVDLVRLSTVSDQLLAGGRWSLITAFAVLHHIPGDSMRLEILNTVHGLLAPGGRFIHSNWQFLNSPRLRARIQPWSAIGLQETDVDPDDYLLDWRSGGTGLRYVHHFSQEELAELAASSGFTVVDTFTSDGKQGNLAIYQEWAAR
jgi:tRNA (uracil-5-)-methyltransferase TRM9